MPIGRIALFAVLVLFAQIWFGAMLQDFGAEINFILLYVMFLSCYHDPTSGMIVGFSLGMAEDVLRVQCFGLSALTYVIVGYLPRVLGNVLFLENLVSQYIFLVIAHVLQLVLDATVEPALTHRLPEHTILLSQKGLSLLFDAIALPILFFIWSKLIGVKKTAVPQRGRGGRFFGIRSP